MTISTIAILDLDYIQNVFKIEEVIIAPTDNPSAEIDINAKAEWEVAIARAHTWIDGNTSYRLEDGTLMPLTELQKHYLQQGTAGVAQIINNMGDDYSVGSLSISMGGTSISQTKTTITELPQQYRQLLEKAGVLDTADFSTNIETCPTGDVAFEDDNPAGSDDKNATENWVTAMFAKKAVASYNNGLTIKGSGIEYDLDAIMNANDTVNVKHVRSDGTVTTSQAQHWLATNITGENQTQIESLKKYVTGLNAQARVEAKTDQILFGNVADIVKFDTADIGKVITDSDASGNVDLTNNTITVTDYTDVAKLRFSVEMLFFATDAGDKSLTLEVEHLASDGTVKADGTYLIGTINWSTETQDRLLKVDVDVINNVVMLGGATKAPIAVGDKFRLRATSNNELVHTVRLKQFTIEDISQVVGATDAIDIFYDDTNSQMGVSNVQEAIETLAGLNTVFDARPLGTDPSSALLWDFINHSVRNYANPNGYQVITNTSSGITITSITRAVSGSNYELLGYLYTNQTDVDKNITAVRSVVVQGSTPNVQFVSARLSGSDPVGPQDYATKNYTDTVIANIPTQKLETYNFYQNINNVSDYSQLLFSGAFNVRRDQNSVSIGALYIYANSTGLWRFNGSSMSSTSYPIGVWYSRSGLVTK